jgi:hypothetical protein
VPFRDVPPLRRPWWEKRVWYSALTADNPQVGYILIPKSVWPGV